MEPKRFKPRFDKLFYIPVSIAGVLLIGGTILAAFEPAALAVMIPCDLLVMYFIISSTVGYVELGESTVLIKFGFFLKREISYSSIRRVEKCRRAYSESMLALKNSFEHVDIRYNVYDVTTVSVTDNEALISELRARCSAHF